MRRTALILLCLILASTAVAAERHLILDPQHTLTPADTAELAGQGVKVLRPLSRGRYLITVAENARFDENDLRVRALKAIDPEDKIHRSVRRELRRGTAYAKLDVVFHDDITIDEARASILAIGGSLVDPLAVSLGERQKLRAHIPATAVDALAADDRVMMIRGPFRLRQESHNATTAAMSGVTTLYAAPYGLTGRDVTLSLFELATPETTHPDFGGRLSLVNFTRCTTATDELCTFNISHATHVSGTIVGSGAGNAQAKGMAPDARLIALNANRDFDAYLSEKENELAARGVVADNNSWGYILGWNRGGTHGWIWEDTEEYFGGYDSDVTAPLDKITRNKDVLMIHSSGNDGNKFGPVSAPFAHQHVDDDLEPIPGKVFCYSANGTGSDCPTPCTPGAETCEVLRHPVNAPFRSVGVTASAKNTLTVGATDSFRVVTSYSSRGPAADGRIKPEVVARGGTDAIGVTSTYLNNGYATTSGTSMSTPAVTGIVGLMTEQWKRITGGVKPSATVLKTVIIATADDILPAGPDYSAGFGFVNAKAAIDLMRADNNSGSRIRSGTIAHGARVEIPMALHSAQTLRVVLSWPDPEVILGFDELDLAAVALVNDLDLKVIGPSGETLPYVLDRNNPGNLATRGVNTIDNTEMVEIANAPAGNYTIVITAKINDNRSPTQPYVVVGNGEVGATAAPCVDVYEPNESPDTAYGLLPSNIAVNGRNCAAGDVDYYQFRVDRTGQVRVTITSGDTPLSVTLGVPGAPTSASADVPANSTRTLTVDYAPTQTPAPSQIFVVKVSPAGTLGANGQYTLTPTFPTATSARSRSSR